MAELISAHRVGFFPGRSFFDNRQGPEALLPDPVFM